jgi:hypothetical protein
MVDLKKFPKVRPIGHPETESLVEPGTVTIHEKMDGANFRFRVDGERILFGSRNVVYKNEKDIANAFEHAVEFIREQVSPTDLNPNYTYFGEAMHKHTLEYEWESVPSFLGFAIYNHGAGEIIPWSDARSVFDLLELPTVPVVEEITGNDVSADYEIPRSAYREDGKGEGVVFWHENGTKAKLRTDEFKEKHNAPTSDPVDFEGHGKLVNQYCTDTRIDKRINSLLDEGHTLSRELMGNGLPQDVSRDILEEHAHEIVGMNETVDLKEYRSLVAKKCVNRIDERMRDNV